ncbi:ArsR family transcriptional regulator [Bacillus lacus]|uniref:ArsR family transcriptional regulator n=1 Tax=Metabacillus lacus TaxID=1983721 RepID=A0A7X2IY79_9BACI|nr:metalloregulator ArsR/SmtB family transcription factor [Metabacillus lacus]MRX71876.1 ArsR family transcriptional regulator [Metabacillus lacus]
MKSLHFTAKKRGTYTIQLHYSILWETALGIAAYTNKPLLHTLSKPENEWEDLGQSLSLELQTELHRVERHNTWKALLQLLHAEKMDSLDDFSSFVNSLKDAELLFICLPYLGEAFQEIRKKAANGEDAALQTLIEEAGSHSFFPDYLTYIAKQEPGNLKKHLLNVLSFWYEEVVREQEEEILKVLKRDYDSMLTLSKTLHAEAFVERATGGVEYLPEPGVPEVLLIPQLIYRPWAVEADIEHTKVFYYPVSNESLHHKDRYAPPQQVVLKHKAIGDEVRLRILKMLFEKEHTLQELTEKLELGKSTVHHHLKLLKAARLIESQGSKHRIRKNSLEALLTELNGYLKGETP